MQPRRQQHRKECRGCEHPCQGSDSERNNRTVLGFAKKSGKTPSPSRAENYRRCSSRRCPFANQKRNLQCCSCCCCWWSAAPIPRIGTLIHVGRNTSFSLDEHFSAFIEDEVASGRYGSASDVVRSALRLLEDRETRLRALRQALIAGEQSGDSTPFDFDEFVARKRAEEPRHR